ncbi:MAG: hypothetical protein SGBAC_003381 [Bacillariaceae sp.]
MRFRKKKIKMEDIGEMDETPEDETFFKEEAKRNLEELSQQLIERTKRETELIRQHLGIDDKGCCLRHPNQFITDKVQPNRRFETIKICLICDSEIQAGGKRQRKSMHNVISDLNTLIEDKTAWRNKTNVLYNGAEYIPDEDEENEQDDPDVFKKKVYEKEEPDKDYSHMLNFYNKEVEEAKARKNKNNSNKNKNKNKSKKKHPDSDESTEINLDVIEQEDKMWKEEVKQRVSHVRAWDGDMALKQNPVYAKYFRMVDVGIPKQAIENSMEMDGLDVRIMSLDPNRPLQDQVDDIPDMAEEEREKLRRNDQLAFLRDDDIFEPLTVEETVDMIHRAYERRAYFMQEMDDERNRNKQKLSNKLLKKLGKGRAPPPPLIEPKRRELPPQPEEEEEQEQEEEEEEEKQEAEPPATPPPKATPPKAAFFARAPAPPAIETPTEVKRTSNRVSWSDREHVVTTEDVDSSLRGDMPLPDTPSTLGGPSTPPPKGSPMSMDTADSSQQSPVFFPADPDDKLPAFQSDQDLKNIGKNNSKRRPFKAVTKLGSTKHAVVRTKEELRAAQKELAQRTVITNSLKTQLESLEKALARKEAEVENLQHELYELDPNDPLCTDTTSRQLEPEAPSSPFKNIDRSDVVKARMNKLSILPRTLPR